MNVEEAYFIADEDLSATIVEAIVEDNVLSFGDHGLGKAW
jgi:hypothetical protein